jgi:hypothetical protein
MFKEKIAIRQIGSPASSTNKTDRHDITEILLKVALNIMNPNLKCLASCCGVIKDKPYY